MLCVLHIAKFQIVHSVDYNAQCTVLFTEWRVLSAAHEPFPAPAAPSVSVEGTVKHPLSLRWLLHCTYLYSDFFTAPLSMLTYTPHLTLRWLLHHTSLYVDFYTTPISTLISTIDNSFQQIPSLSLHQADLHDYIDNWLSRCNTPLSLAVLPSFFIWMLPHVFLKCALKLKSLLALIACKCDSLSEPTHFTFHCKFPATNAVLTVPCASQDRWQHETSYHSDGNQEECDKEQHYITKYSAGKKTGAGNSFLCSIVVTFNRMRMFVSSS